MGVKTIDKQVRSLIVEFRLDKTLFKAVHIVLVQIALSDIYANIFTVTKTFAYVPNVALFPHFAFNHNKGGSQSALSHQNLHYTIAYS